MTSRNDNDVDRGWAWMVLIAVYAGRLFLSTSLFMSGVLYVALLDYFNDDITKTSIIGALNTGLMCFFGPLASAVIDRFSCRTSMVVGGVLVSASYFISFFVNSVDGLIITLGVLGGVANCLVSVPFSVSLGYYFDKRRNTVIVISVAFIGLAMFFASPVALYLLETYSLKGTFMIVSALNAHLIIFGVICKPSTNELEIKRTKKKMSEQVNALGHHSKLVECFRTFISVFSSVFSGLFKNIAYLFFLLSTSTWNFLISVCLMHLPNYVISKGHPPSAITLIMTTFSVSNTLGRLFPVLTMATTKIDNLVLHFLVLGVAGIVTLTFPLYSHFRAAGYIFAGVAGFFAGVPNSIMTPTSLRLVGVTNLSSAHGLEIFFCGIGILAGPTAAGWLYERTGDYVNSFMMSGIVVTVGCVFGIVSKLRAKDLDKSAVRADMDIAEEAAALRDDENLKPRVLDELSP